MESRKVRAQHYRERAEELLAKAEDFEDPNNCLTIKLLAEEYLGMADRLERPADAHDLPGGTEPYP